MNTPDKRPDAAVDEILEELRAKAGAPEKSADSELDRILAELKGGAEAPVPPAAPAAAGAQPERESQPPPAAPTQTAPVPKASQPPAGPGPVLAPEDKSGQEAQAETTSAPGPEKAAKGQDTLAQAAPATADPTATRRLPILGDPEKLEPIGPRAGKAAALEKVDHDKFAGDAELASWFDPEAGMHTSKKEMKQAEKARKKQRKEDERARKLAAKKGGGQEPAAPAPAQTEEVAAPLPPQPLEKGLFDAAEAEGPQEAPVLSRPRPQETDVPVAAKPAAEKPAAPQKAQVVPAAEAPPVAEEKQAAKPAEKQKAAAQTTQQEPPPRAQKAEAPPAAQQVKPVPAGGVSLFDFARQGEPPEEEPKTAAQPAPEATAPPAAASAAEKQVATQKEQVFEAAEAAPVQAVQQAATPAGKQVAPAAPPRAQKAEEAPQKTQVFGAKAAGAQAPQPAGMTGGEAPRLQPQAPPEKEAPGEKTQAFEAIRTSVGRQLDEPAGHARETGRKAPAEKQPDAQMTQEFKAQAAVQAAADPGAAKQPADQKTRPFGAAGAATMAAAAATAKTQVVEGAATAAKEAGDTQVFGAAEAVAGVPAGEKETTKQFDLEDDAVRRVPTAAYTQEFEQGAGGNEAPEAAEEAPEEAPGQKGLGQGQKNLYVDEMVDDKFREFFGETVIVEREELEQSQKIKTKRKARKSRTALLTGEFAKMTEAAEDESAEDFDDYSRPQDAEQVEADLVALRQTLLIRCVVSGAAALLLAWMAFGYGGVLPLPAFMSVATGALVFAGIYLALLVGVIVLNFTTVASGLIGLFSEPTTDTTGAIATVAALLQGVVLFVQLMTGFPPDVTLFGPIAALVLCFNALGKRVRSSAILENFRLASGGLEHSAAYVLDGGSEPETAPKVVYNLTKGLEEEHPSILISRPAALVKGFLRQSFSMRWSDGMGRILGWVVLGAALVSAVVAYATVRDLMEAITCLAAAACVAAPLSATLVSGIPSRLLQMGSGKIGAVVPGWSAIEELGNVNVVMAGARDIFPPNTVFLKGIKTFEQERIDLAILYAASVLVEACDTLRDIFLAVIQGKSEILFKVENLLSEPGRGFTAFVENNRIIIGTREMLQMHDIDPPPLEVEMKYTGDGNLPVYLAVSGKLFAMFIISYAPDSEVQGTLDGLVKSGVSMLVTSEDPNVTNELIEEVYQLPKGVVKVLGRRERELLEPLRSYLPEGEGVMTHIGTFTSFIGGMRAAAGCAASERMSTIVQVASVALACVLSLLLAISGGLAILSLSIVLLYQFGWTLLVSILPFSRRY